MATAKMKVWLKKHNWANIYIFIGSEPVKDKDFFLFRLAKLYA